MFEIGDEVLLSNFGGNRVIVNSKASGIRGLSQMFEDWGHVWKVCKVEDNLVTVVSTKWSSLQTLYIATRRKCYDISAILNGICERVYSPINSGLKARSLSEEDMTLEVVNLCKDILKQGPIWLDPGDKKAIGEMWEIDHEIEFNLNTSTCKNPNEMFSDVDGISIGAHEMPTGYSTQKHIASAFVVPIITIDTDVFKVLIIRR